MLVTARELDCRRVRDGLDEPEIWQDSGVPLAYFGVLWAGYNLIVGLAGRSAALRGGEIRPATFARRGRRVAHHRVFRDFGMASFLGWGRILFGTLVQVSRGLGEVLFLNALNEKIPSAFSEAAPPRGRHFRTR